MEAKIILTVNHLGECLLVSLSEHSTFGSFRDKLIEKWGNKVVETFSCRCTVGSVTGICLSSDEDVRNLWMLCSFSAVRVVSVVLDIIGPSNEVRDCVCSIDSSPLEDTVLHSSSSSNKSTHSRNEDSGSVDLLPYYDVCPPVKKRPLLSDSWADVFKGGVGSIFRGGAAEFREELIKYSSHLGFKFVYVRNDGRYIHVKCKEADKSNCRWVIKARRQPVTLFFEVHTAYLLHDCIGNLCSDDSKRLGSKILGSLVKGNIKNNPSLNGKDIVSSMMDNYGLDIPYWKAYRAAETAKSDIFGSYQDSYDQLRWYCNAIVMTNPGSVVELQFDQCSHRFERLFVAFKACVDGFKSCRPMLFIDGTFMKCRAKGTFLAATSKDGNNGLFPVCFAVVSAENTDNWQWFLEKIRDNVHHEERISYISDRNLGLMSAFPKVFEDSQNFFCLFHLMNNLKSRFGGKGCKYLRVNLVEMFKHVAYAPTLRLFEDKLAQFLESGGPKASEFIIDIKPYEKWAVAYSPIISRFGEMTSNAAESFNSWIDESRALPITYMIDHIRTKISCWFVKRRKISDDWNQLLVPLKDGLWHMFVEDGRSWFVSLCPGGDYLVSSDPSVKVDLRTKDCSCFQWKVSGFPCVHAVAVIRRDSSNIHSHIDPCFFTATYKKCYESNLNPIPETLKFEFQLVEGEEKLLPPILNRPIGRPPKCRIPSVGEFRNGKRYQHSKS